MYCGKNILPAICHPTKCCVTHTFSTVVVPHIHPTHTTNVHHQVIQHQHFFPHTESMANQVTNQHFSCGTRPPMGMPGAFRPGFVPAQIRGPGPFFRR